ncbi:MAG: pyridoxal-phosphate dependent enzyme [Propionibacteriaceae bacterium]|nr:pyridoxal-phosphate dependent enzyme [Propionibacteriaceae bacterium]
MSSPEDAWYFNPSPREWPPLTPRARAFHASLPGYAPTPLVDAPELAAMLDVGHVLIKDESARFDLGAFKILGATWACVQALTAESGYDGPPDLAALREYLLSRAGPDGAAFTLVTATDGNHGRAVARAARLLGLPARIFLPRGVPDAVFDRIGAEDAAMTVVDSVYDGAVDAAKQFVADGPGRLLIQDMGWEGYDAVPDWIAEGYLTLTSEIDDQIASLGLDGVDLVAVPIGTGTLGQAVVQHFRGTGRVRTTRVMSVEPDTAACLLASLRAGEIVTVPTASTIANGLNCGTPSSTGWPWLRDGLSAAVAVSDDELRKAIADLAKVGVASGPSGCAAFAGLTAALTDPARRSALGIDAASVVVALSTESPIPGVS